MVSIRWFLAASVTLLVASVAAADWPSIALEQRFSGFDRPVLVTHAGDGSGRIFVVEQEGRVRVIDRGEVLAEPFLDISDRVSCCGERGLLGLAFPPTFTIDGRFYVNYTDAAGDTAVARFVVSADDPNRADPASEEILLAIDQPYSNHNGGHLAFGPDGHLWIATGDGGSAGDPQDNAQNPLSLLGKLLRIDVSSGQQPYGIPADNPFASGATHRPEIWALGLRNPWRFAFDRATDRLFIADVGQSSFEEVNVETVASGGGLNYGWRIMEGRHCYDPDPCDVAGLVLPVVEYDHSLGCSVTGGEVYRGSRWSRLDGIYLYGDYCSGRIWGLRRADGGWESRELADSGLTIASFGKDELGAVYAVDLAAGTIHAVTDPDAEQRERLVVPAVAHLTGSGGTRWRSDLVVANPRGEDASLSLVYRWDGGQASIETALPAGGSVEWRDAPASLFGVGDDDEVAGTVELLSDLPVVATARSYAAGSGGSYGQLLPALADSDALGPGDVGVVAGLARTSERYTNLGVVNLGETSCTVVVELASSSGVPIGEPFTVELEPMRWSQIFDVLAGSGELEAAWARVRVTSPGGRAWGYASVIDRTSRDPTTIPVRRSF